MAATGTVRHPGIDHRASRRAVWRGCYHDRPAAPRARNPRPTLRSDRVSFISARSTRLDARPRLCRRFDRHRWQSLEEARPDCDHVERYRLARARATTIEAQYRQTSDRIEVDTGLAVIISPGATAVCMTGLPMSV